MQARLPRPPVPAPARLAATTTGARPAGRRGWSVPPTLAAVLLVSLAVKLALWAGYLAAGDAALLLQGDSREYHDSARALLETGTFAVSPELHLPQTFRTPGYPSFLAAAYAVVGERPAAALLVQLVLSVATLALVYLLVRRAWGARVALLATVLLALDVGSLLLSLALLTETLFTLLLVAALACGAAVLTRPDRRRWALGMGIALAACVLVRPVAYYLVMPVALGVAVHARHARWGARETAWVLALLLVPYASAVGGWRYRNYQVTGDSAFTRVDATVLLFYRGAAIVARRDGIGLDEARARLSAEFGDPSDPRAADPARWRREGIALIRRNPGIYARVVASGVLQSLLRPAGLRLGSAAAPEPAWTEEVRRAGPLDGVAARLARRGPLYAATFVFDALMVVVTTGAAAYAVARLAAARRLSVVDVFLLGVVLYLLLVPAGATSDARGRVPIEPVLALYAARGLVDLRARLRPASRRPALS